MSIGSTSQGTDFALDVLGRYVCNGFDEALANSDPGYRAAAGLPPRGDMRPFDFIIIGGGTFGAALAEHLWFRSADRSERVLVLEAGRWSCRSTCRTSRSSGSARRRAHRSPAQKEVWGLAWHAGIAFPGLAYCVGGRRSTGAAGRRACSLRTAAERLAEGGTGRPEAEDPARRDQGLLPPIKRSDRRDRDQRLHLR